MSALLLDGRALARERRRQICDEVARFVAAHDIPPQLAIIQVLGDAASDHYTHTVRNLCRQVGISCHLEALPATTSQTLLNQTIARLSDDPSVHGLLIELPLPPHLSAEVALSYLDHRKDVDGIHPMNAGLLAQGRPSFVPGTAAGCLELLHHSDIPLRGARVVVIGHSIVVGRPLAALFLQANATITVCHEYTINLADIVREGEIVAVAVGKPRLVTADMLCRNAVVVDIGINVLSDGRVVGDVDFERAVDVVRAITPVPGGTGPLTNIMLLRNVLTAASQQMGDRDRG